MHRMGIRAGLAALLVTAGATAARADDPPAGDTPTPWYKRMFGAKTELQQPQTVPQWMAQKRLDP